MNARFLKTLLLAAVIVGGIWVLLNRDKIQEPGDVVRLINENLPVVPLEFGSATQDDSASGLTTGIQSSYPVQRPSVATPNARRFITNVVRIASFRLNQQISGPQTDHAIDMLADICRRYDAIAIQEIDAADNTWLVRLTDRMNALGSIGITSQPNSKPAEGNKADYFFISNGGRSSNPQTQSAIVFNRQTLELDASQWYTVNDPDNILSRDPMVGLFRARGPNPSEAFTFTLVNVQIDSQRAGKELAYLSELFRAIRNDGRGEDDVLIVGSFNGGDRDLQPMRKQAGLTWVVSDRPTDTANQSQSDNLVFSEVATIEFTGRGGVFDFMRHYNLRLDDAMGISQHMPVWAEFSIFEGSSPTRPITPSGRVANDGGLGSR